MSSAAAAKSILKQGARKAPTVTDEQKAKAETDRKNLKIALKHAHVIQHRKDVEATILKATVELADIPAASTSTAREARRLLSAVQIFQPSDYDTLVEERRVNGKCGYVLCGNAPRIVTMGKNAAWKLKEGMSDYCSKDCAKKGLFVKAQLSQVPAWEREPDRVPDIQLPEDDRLPEHDSALRRANRTAQIDQWRQKVADNEELAVERGEKPTSFRPQQVMTDTIVEKKPTSAKPSAPGLESAEYNFIEGHQTKPIRKLDTLLPEDGEDEKEEPEEYDDDEDNHND